MPVRTYLSPLIRYTIESGNFALLRNIRACTAASPRGWRPRFAMGETGRGSLPSSLPLSPPSSPAEARGVLRGRCRALSLSLSLFLFLARSLSGSGFPDLLRSFARSLPSPPLPSSTPLHSLPLLAASSIQRAKKEESQWRPPPQPAAASP